MTDGEMEGEYESSYTCSSVVVRSSWGKGADDVRFALCVYLRHGLALSGSQLLSVFVSRNKTGKFQRNRTWKLLLVSNENVEVFVPGITHEPENLESYITKVVFVH